ncbi:hypothetical protein [Stenotrophomonas maltophilia]|uniref:hypothetical protein n=1 Tax=Stenotrophomonas maltophilia TaxID=40324 RepID=UPI00069FA00F|nr:hypothetical protein [Stenotrophomonas maltophilia]
MNNVNRAYSLLEVKNYDDDRQVITGLATTPEPDRYGDIVEPLGAKFAAELPLLWQHRHDSPVGIVKFGKPTAKGIPFTANVAKGLRVLQVVALPAVSGPPIEVGQFFPGARIGIAIPSPRFYYFAQSQDRCTMTADYFHMTSDNRIFISRLQTVQQTLITNTFPVGGVTMGPQNATIFIVDLTEVPLGFG